MEKRDYYEILGVERNATKDEIRKAYRKLARKVHPDVNPGDADAELKFKEVSEAYQVLSDDQKRSMYDRFGHDGLSGGAGMGFEDFGFGDIGDIFDAFFGGGARRGRSRPRGPARGADLRYDLEISLHEAAFGVARDITIPVLMKCGDCDGTGSQSGSISTACQRCHGTGEIRQARQTLLGQVMSVQPCPACGGRGQVVIDPCNRCNGTGRSRGEKTVRVSVPAGVDTGQKLRLSGEGEAGELGGPPGDLYVVIHVMEHEFFKRDGQDLFCEIPVSFTQAALGDEIQVPTIHGYEKMKIPAGTQTGSVFRLREKGIPHLRGRHRGDQHVVVKVVTPSKLSSKQKKLLRQFAEESGENTSRPLKGFLDKIRDILIPEE